MITTSDARNILYRHFLPVCVDSDVELMPEFNTGGDDVRTRRGVIHVKAFTRGRIWDKCFAEVNIHVPDPVRDTADLASLEALERKFAQHSMGHGSHDGTPYLFRCESTSIHSDGQLHTHFINVRILFRALSTIE